MTIQDSCNNFSSFSWGLKGVTNYEKGGRLTCSNGRKSSTFDSLYDSMEEEEEEEESPSVWHKLKTGHSELNIIIALSLTQNLLQANHENDEALQCHRWEVAVAEHQWHGHVIRSFDPCYRQKCPT